MEIKTEKQGDIVLMELTGQLDSKTSRELEGVVSEQFAAGESKFLVDLTGVDYVSSAGLRIFLMLAKKVKPKKGMAVLCGANAEVLKVFEIVKLTKMLNVVSSREEGLGRFG